MSTPVRNKKRVFRDLFNVLRTHTSLSVDYPLHKALYPNTSDIEDDLIQNSNIIDYHIDSHSKSDILIEYNDSVYYCFTGENVTTDSINTDYFESENELFNGLWTLVQSQLIKSCLSSASPIEIYNEVLSYDDLTENASVAKEIDVNDITSYFINLNIYKVNPDTPYSFKNLYQIKGYFNVKLDKNSIIYSDSVKTNFLSIFESGLKSIPMDIVELAYISSQYKQVFLELYRCIEQLYPVPILQKLLQMEGITLTCPIMTAELLETQLNWRPKEADAIEAVFKDLDQVIIDKFDTVKSDTEYSALGNAAFVYRLRNANVHFRKKLGKGTLDRSKWESLIDVMLEATLYLYNKYDSKILFNE